MGGGGEGEHSPYNGLFGEGSYFKLECTKVRVLAISSIEKGRQNCHLNI